MPVLLCGVMLLGETASLRSRSDAQQTDRGSYYVFRGGMTLGFTVALVTWWLGEQPAALGIGRWSVWAGAALVAAGVSLRVWSMRTLGEYFTRVVHVSSSQKVVETGPYRLLRHPSYTGVALSALGVGLAMANVAGILLTCVPFLIGVSYRIRVEERALLEAIGEPYREYMKRTKRLIPYVL